MIFLFYHEGMDQLLEVRSSDPEKFYSGCFYYQAIEFVGEPLILIDFYPDSKRGDRIMPFGKYRGKDISEVSDDYLKWLGGVAYGPLRLWCEEEMVKRFGAVVPPASSSINYVPYDDEFGGDDTMLGEEVDCGDFPNGTW